MKKITFLTHLNTLKPSEVTKFGTWLKATFSEATVLLKTYTFYVTFYRKKTTLPSYEAAYEEIFDKKADSEKDIRNLQNSISDLFLKLKAYLIQQKIMETSFEKEMIWLQVLEERNLPHQQSLQFKQLLKKSGSAKDNWTQLYPARIYEMKYFNNTVKKESLTTDWLEKGIAVLDTFYIKMLFKFNNELLNRNQVLSADHQDTKSALFRSVYDAVSDDPARFPIRVQHYYYIHEFLVNRNDASFHKLRIFLTQHRQELHKDDRHITILYLTNYVARQLKNKDYKLSRIGLEIYKSGLSGEQDLIHSDTIDDTIFYNIVNLACRLEETAWATSFVETFQHYLADHIRQDAVELARIMLAFEQGQFETVIRNNPARQRGSIHYKIFARVYVLAAYYELEQTDKLNTDCVSFMKLIGRTTKLSETSKKAIISFSKILKLLVEQKLSKRKIQETFNASKPIHYEKWLTQKLKAYRRFK